MTSYQFQGEAGIIMTQLIQRGSMPYYLKWSSLIHTMMMLRGLRGRGGGCSRCWSSWWVCVTVCDHDSEGDERIMSWRQRVCVCVCAMPFGVMLQDDRLKHQTQDFTRYQWGEKNNLTHAANDYRHAWCKLFWGKGSEMKGMFWIPILNEALISALLDAAYTLVAGLMRTTQCKTRKSTLGRSVVKCIMGL